MSSPDQDGISTGASHVMRQDLERRAVELVSGERRMGLARPLRAVAGFLRNERWATLPLRWPHPRSLVALAAGHAEECTCSILRGQHGGSAHAPPSAQGNLLWYLADRRAPIGEAPVRGQGRTLEEARRVEDLAKPLDPGLAWVEGQGRGGRCRPRPSFRAARQTIPRLRAVASFPPWVKAGRSTRVIAAD
jgi:hypothetical protein